MKWQLLPKQVEKTVDLDHDSERDEENHYKSKQISLIIMVLIKWHLLPKQVENRVDLYHNNDWDEESHIECK